MALQRNMIRNQFNYSFINYFIFVSIWYFVAHFIIVVSNDVQQSIKLIQFVCTAFLCARCRHVICRVWYSLWLNVTSCQFIWTCSLCRHIEQCGKCTHTHTFATNTCREAWVAGGSMKAARFSVYCTDFSFLSICWNFRKISVIRCFESKSLIRLKVAQLSNLLCVRVVGICLCVLCFTFYIT